MSRQNPMYLTENEAAAQLLKTTIQICPFRSSSTKVFKVIFSFLFHPVRTVASYTGKREHKITACLSCIPTNKMLEQIPASCIWKIHKKSKELVTITTELGLLSQCCWEQRTRKQVLST